MKVHCNGIKYNQPLHHYATHHILFDRIPPLINQINKNDLWKWNNQKQKKMVVSAAGNNNEPSSALWSMVLSNNNDSIIYQNIKCQHEVFDVWK